MIYLFVIKVGELKKFNYINIMENTYIIGEIGINHQGDINIAKRLIDIAAAAGCDAVKFQKRNPNICVPEEQNSLVSISLGFRFVSILK